MPKRIAIMQPYLFPYPGYFQLAFNVDEFWLLDTVSFVQSGWMNRNRLRDPQGRTNSFTLPIAAGPHDAPVTERAYHAKAGRALHKLRRRLEQSYARARLRDEVLAVIDAVTEEFDRVGGDFTHITAFALSCCFDALRLDTPLKRVSELDLPAYLTGQERLIAACRRAGAEEYLNMSGGQALYESTPFAAAGVELLFLEPRLLAYPQCGPTFIPGLSVLDLIANVAPDERHSFLQAGRVFSAASRPG